MLPIDTSGSMSESSDGMQYLFQHLFHVSEALIRLRVGYEALWYDRRNLLKLFQNCLSSTSENYIAITSSGGGCSSSSGGGRGGSSSSLVVVVV
jgi:hypothetical protein